MHALVAGKGFLHNTGIIAKEIFFLIALKVAHAGFSTIHSPFRFLAGKKFKMAPCCRICYAEKWNVKK